MAASIITVGAGVIAKILGYVREAVVANYFGTAAIFDVFIIAFTLPEIITTIIAQALPAGLIPSLGNAAFKESDKRSYFWSGLFSFAVIFGLISILIFFLKSDILRWISPYITGDQLALGNRILSILSSYILFSGLAYYFQGWLYGQKHFVAPVTSGIILDLAVLAGVWIFYGKLNILALAYGWLLASIALFIYNGIFVFLVIKPSWGISLDNPWVRGLLRSVLTIALLECISLSFPIIDRHLAAKYLGAGQISALRYATILMQIPVMMIVTSFYTASFPWISDLSNSREAERLRKFYKESIRLVIFVMLIIAAGVAIFARDIVRVSFQRGAFNLESLNLTAGPLFYYAIGLVFYSIYIFQMRFYYARFAYMRLGIILLIMLVIKAVFSSLLVHPMHQNGLVLATAIMWLSGFLLMTFDLGRHLKVPFGELISPSIGKAILITGVISLIWQFIGKFWISSQDISLLALFGKLIALGMAGSAIYFAAAYILNLPELRSILDRIIARLGFFRSKIT